MKPSHICQSKWCRRLAARKNCKCSKCKMREWRKNNPEATLLAQIRWRAKRDKREFNLTLEWFKAFLLERNYRKCDHQIDRISVAKGYTMDNLQVLTIEENIAKGNRERGAQMQIL